MLLEGLAQHLGPALEVVGLGEPATALGGRVDRSGRQLVGDGRGDAVDEFVGLVDDEQVVLGQHLAPLEGVDRHEGVVRHDDVDLLRVGARHFDEAVLDDGALAAEALVARDGDLAPRPLGHAGHEFVAVAGFGLVGPLPQAHDLAAGASGVFVDLADAHERALVVVRVATGELVLAQVVAPPLDERVRGPAPEQRFERVGEARHVAIDDLRLEGERRRGHDGRLVHLERVTDRGHEVRQ